MPRRSTLQLTDLSRAMLKGEVPVQLRESVSTPGGKTKRAAKVRQVPSLDLPARDRFFRLKAWRGEVYGHNLPA